MLRVVQSFLDEISETSPAFQVKLLRVLQQRTIRPVGGSQEKPVDIRIISATNQPLETLLHSSFRKDLLYRISVINIHIPPLRNRVEDIPILANHFLRRHNRRQSKNVILPSATIDWMKQLAWRGNVRELENAIERAVTMNISGEIHPRDFVNFGFPLEPAEKIENTVTDETLASIDQVTRHHILRVLGKTGGSKLRAAKILGIARPSLYRMARRLGIDLDASAQPDPEKKHR
jgi:transcriptional regulator with PAS, ATPase and Fis domain